MQEERERERGGGLDRRRVQMQMRIRDASKGELCYAGVTDCVREGVCVPANSNNIDLALRPFGPTHITHYIDVHRIASRPTERVPGTYCLLLLRTPPAEVLEDRRCALRRVGPWGEAPPGGEAVHVSERN